MALEAFNNLKDRKKAHLLNSISTCLRKTSYDDLSVNDIVEEADISRGSFYNYFANKNDAVFSLVESKFKEHFELYIESIKTSNYSLFEGTKKMYYEIENILSDEINMTIMKNLKFFSELGIEIVKSNKHRQYLENIVKWLVENTVEGKQYINSVKKMSNVLDMILILILNTILLKIIYKNNANIINDKESFEYKLSLIEKGIK